MAWTLFLLMLLIYCSGVHSQPTLTQTPSQSVSPRKTTKLSCTISNNNNNIYWYQQRSGKPPRYVHCDDCSRGDGIPDRFTASRSGNVGYLTISNCQPEDEAYYYCAMWYSSGSSSQYIFGGGTQLAISYGPAVPPTVNVFPPSNEEIASKNKATLVCLVNDFSPLPITVSWEADGTAVSSGVETTKPMKVNGKYVASSYLTLTPSDWERCNSYTCKVTHEGSNYVKSVSHSQCP